MLNKKALAGTPSTPPVYVEDVFSTYLYTGTGSAITINNGVDLSGKGGLVWNKVRTGTTTGEHYLIDTVRGSNKLLSTSSTAAEDTSSTAITAFNADGFSLGTNGIVNTNARTYCTWTFREQAKFFDVVTGTGGGTFNHNLGVTPGMIIIKLTNGTSNWWTVHRSSNGYFYLNDSVAAASTGTPGIAASGAWVNANSTTFSTTQFVSSGESFVAYLFAHNAGGFGAAGTDNVISCGSFTTDGSGGYSVNLGYEAQYVLIKRTDGTGNWLILDIMRGAAVSADTSRVLKADLVAAEATDYVLMSPNATGFGADSSLSNLSGSSTYIYMAIRRPMKTPTSGTEVFNSVLWTGNGAASRAISGVGFSPDFVSCNGRSGSGADGLKYWVDRLRGMPGNLSPYSTNGQGSDAQYGPQSFQQNGFTLGPSDGGAGSFNESSGLYNAWNFRRATGFFDIVCYTGTGSAQNITHNLGVVPEMMIVKSRNTGSTSWMTYHKDVNGGVNPQNYYLLLQGTGTPVALTAVWNDTAPTSSVFTVGSQGSSGASGRTYVAYLFATVAGVSKVGSYTGNGSNQTINCGFTAGARFVMIKRTDSTGDWYVYDTARGIVSGNDPQLKLNTTDAEATGYDAVDPDNSGFIVNNDATNFPINVNNATYIYLAIA